jgi:translation initiation factor 2B subunit (eIF-2B alpha/beta/delta family)
MDAPISAAPDEISLPVVDAMEAELSNLVQQEISLKPASQIENSAEQIRSSVARLTSSSIEDLEGLKSELQKLQEFLNSEVEKVQREIESALAGITIIVETIAPWKTTTVSEAAAHPIITRTAQRSPFAANPSSNRI